MFHKRFSERTLVADCRPTYLGTTYKGTRSRTVSGHICHRWDATTPYSHGFTAEDFPDDSLSDANNYCRNPDGDPDGPWCYTIDPDIGRETCGIQLCIHLGKCLPIKVTENYVEFALMKTIVWV